MNLEVCPRAGRLLCARPELHAGSGSRVHPGPDVVEIAPLSVFIWEET